RRATGDHCNTAFGGAIASRHASIKSAADGVPIGTELGHCTRRLGCAETAIQDRAKASARSAIRGKTKAPPPDVSVHDQESRISTSAPAGSFHSTWTRFSVPDS